MPQVKWVIVCSRATVDEGTKALSLIEIIEGLKAATPPPTPPPPGQLMVPIQFDVAFHCVRLPSDPPQIYQAQVVLKDPKGDVLGTSPVKLDLQAVLGGRAIVRFMGLPITSAGTYSISVDFLDTTTNNWVTKGQTEIEVSF
jgi:hypothetical protein